MMLGLGCNMKILILDKLTDLSVINEWPVTVTIFSRQFTLWKVNIMWTQAIKFVLICGEKVPVTLIGKAEKKNWYIIVPLLHMGR